jgi:hypothetical protein
MKLKTPTLLPSWRHGITYCFGCALYLTASVNARASAVITEATGALAADIQAAVVNFRNSIALGGPNRNAEVGPFTTGFRNINWDGVGDNLSDPHLLPGNFFAVNSPRGLLMQTPGRGFLLSADSDNPDARPTEFGGIDASYPGNFQPFSGQRLFIADGSTVTLNSFSVPGSPGTAASVFGFGVVFTDVDILGSTSLTFFDINGVQLGVFTAPVFNNGFSFIGVSFNAGELVGSVRINSGSEALEAGVIDGGAFDVVAMDDFMYSEPQAVVPEASTAVLLTLGLTSLVGTMRRRAPVPICA